MSAFFIIAKKYTRRYAIDSNSLSVIPNISRGTNRVLITLFIEYNVAITNPLERKKKKTRLAHICDMAVSSG